MQGRAVYLVAGRRTPIGRYGGALAKVRADDLAAHPMKALVAELPGVDWEAVDEVVYVCANQAGEDNRNVARMAVLLAGLPVEIPGATVNRLCGSGMEAVGDAARAIAAGEADICLAGGSESMTRAPFVVARSAEPFPRALDLADTRLGWRLVSPRMQEMYPPIALGETAENVAGRYGITRERQDEWALRSHQLAAAARDAGRFDAEIVPVSERPGFCQDEGINAALTAVDLAAKKPAFRKGGTVTGGNSSPLNDGAAALLLMSGDTVRRAGLTPLARYVGSAAAGVHPDYMGIGPVPAMHKALGRAGWRLEEVDLIEVNEAFAAQSVAVTDELKCDPGLVNVNGGAIAIGHPLGCSGARIITTLLHEMRRRGAARGAATMCIGVGQGIASLWEAA